MIFFELLIKYWYFFLLFGILSIIFAKFLTQFIKTLLNKFSTKSPIIKKYWIFIIPFFVFSLILYICILHFSSEKSVDRNISLANQLTTMIFAIYAGYLAFLQLVENRIDKLLETATIHFRNQRYEKAIKLYEEIISMNSENETAICELLEIYCITKKFKEFENKFLRYKNSKLDKRGKMLEFYFQYLKNIFDGNNGKGKEVIKQTIKFCKKNGLPQILWGFGEVQESSPYKDLKGDAKIEFDDFLNYISGKIENKENFEKQFC